MYAHWTVLICSEYWHFPNLTRRESLRDIEACLAANRTKLFHMGLAQAPARSTLADALNIRDCRIYEAFAQLLVSRARALYAEDSVLGIDATIYALDASTVDLCLSLFEWAPFRANRAAIKLHTLLDLRGAIPAFLYISGGKLNEVNVLDLLPIEAGSFYVMDRGYLDFRRLLRYAPSRSFLRYTRQISDGCEACLLQRRRPQPRSHLRPTRHV